MVWPRYQPFGSGFGHAGSTSNRGACTAPFACASAVFCSALEPAPSAAMAASSIEPMNRFRFIGVLRRTKRNHEDTKHTKTHEKDHFFRGLFEASCFRGCICFYRPLLTNFCTL